MAESLALLTRLYDLIAQYRTEVTVTGLWVLGPLVTFMALQHIKRIAPMWLHRRLSDAEVSGLAFVVSILLTTVVGTAWCDVPADVLAVHSLLIAIVLPYAVKWWMTWAEVKNPALWRALRADRRRSGTPNSRHSSPVDVSSKFKKNLGHRKKDMDDTDMFI